MKTAVEGNFGHLTLTWFGKQPYGMTLATGAKLGRYEIRSKIGAGGMGEVYLAQDTKLERKVALKILTVEIARDQQPLHRFMQEARAASALSHPNVAHIYEIGEAKGLHFIAMEYVEGEGLDKKIGGRPVGVTEIMDIAIQVADAIDEAHAKGITHRDIKSSNIMITPRGRVKVLDFGLAKIAVGATLRTSDSEVAPPVETTTGVVMGTVNYMSPEQALGREVDHRTDIFSFGVVLYEMATGRLPFTGETVTETIDRIVHGQPEAIARLNYELPAEFEVIVKKALRKDRDERYQVIRDLVIDLKDLKRELDISERLERSAVPTLTSIEVSPPPLMQASAVTTDSPAPESGTILAARPTTSAEYIFNEIKRHRAGALVIFSAVLVAAIALGVGLYKFAAQRNHTGATKPINAILSANLKISRLTENGKAEDAAISPDGKYVVYVLKDRTQQSLWVRQVATNSNVSIVAPANVQYEGETFSPDGDYVYYVVTEQRNPDGALYQVPSLGGPPRKILVDIESSITFSPDGHRIAFIRNSEAASGEDQLIIANADGTDERKVAARKADEPFYFGLAWSPDGKVISCGAGSYTRQAVVTVETESGAQMEITAQRFSDVGSISWLADGSGMIISASTQESYLNQLWLIGYPGGEARKITNDLSEYLGASCTSDSKSLVTVRSERTSNIWVAPTGDANRAKQITSGKLEGDIGITWTPDGRIAYASFVSGNADIWIMNSDGSSQKQLTIDTAHDYDPVVSPDGRYIVFVSERSGFPGLWRMDLEGGDLKQLTQGQGEYEPGISPDGRWIVFGSARSAKWTLWKVPIDGGQPVQLTDKLTWGSGISPDGKLIACFYKGEQPNSPWRIMILPFDGGPPVKTFDTVSAPDADAIDAAISWTPDGRAITYLAQQGGYYNLWSQPIDGSQAKKLTDFKENEVRQRAWSHDGKQLALTRGTTTNDVVLISRFR